MATQLPTLRALKAVLPKWLIAIRAAEQALQGSCDQDFGRDQSHEVP